MTMSRPFIIGAWVVFVCLAAIMISAVLVFKHETEDRLGLLFEHRQTEIVNALDERLEGFSVLLRSGRGLYEGSSKVEDAEWQRHYNSLNIRETYPEVLQLGYAIGKDGDVTVRYLAPAASHSPLLGYDLSEDMNIGRALQRAEETGHPTLAMANKETVARAGLPAGRKYMVLVLPHYAAGSTAAQGYIYAIFETEALMDHVLSTLSWRDVQLQLETDNAGVVYDSEPAAAKPSSGMMRDWRADRDLQMRGLDLHMHFTTLPNFGHRLGQIELIWVLIGGAVAGFVILISALLMALGHHKGSSLSRDLARMETERLESDNLLQILFKSAPVSLAMFDKNLCYLAHSDKWLRDIGMEGMDIIGKNHYDLFPDYLRSNPDSRSRVQRILNGETVMEPKMKFVRADGTWDFMRYEGRPWRNLKGEIEGIISFRETITEQVRSEEELRRYAREVEQFAYIASHDLKAPLRGIDNLAKWIAEDMEKVMTPEVRENLAMLRSRVSRLEVLLDDILRYSRAGHVVEQPKIVDTRELIESINKLHPWGDKFTITCDGDMPVLNSPRTPLEQIFTNIIANAVKHHDKDSGKITITATMQDEFYEFAVQDDGPGIPPEFHERVFGLFQTLKPRDQREGSGLGMSIIKKLVEWQRGRVWIVSEKGQRGTAIHFEWPRNFQERVLENAA